MAMEKPTKKVEKKNEKQSVEFSSIELSIGVGTLKEKIAMEKVENMTNENQGLEAL